MQSVGEGSESQTGSALRKDASARRHDSSRASNYSVLQAMNIQKPNLERFLAPGVSLGYKAAQEEASHHSPNPKKWAKQNHRFKDEVSPNYNSKLDPSKDRAATITKLDKCLKSSSPSRRQVRLGSTEKQHCSGPSEKEKHSVPRGKGKAGVEGSMWQDLGETHIVRATSIYANVPLSRVNELNDIIERSKERARKTHDQYHSRGTISSQQRIKGSRKRGVKGHPNKTYEHATSPKSTCSEYSQDFMKSESMKQTAFAGTGAPSSAAVGSTPFGSKKSAAKNFKTGEEARKLASIEQGLYYAAHVEITKPKTRSKAKKRRSTLNTAASRGVVGAERNCVSNEPFRQGMQTAVNGLKQPNQHDQQVKGPIDFQKPPQNRSSEGQSAEGSEQAATPGELQKQILKLSSCGSDNELVSIEEAGFRATGSEDENEVESADNRPEGKDDGVLSPPTVPTGDADLDNSVTSYYGCEAQAKSKGQNSKFTVVKRGGVQQRTLYGAERSSLKSKRKERSLKQVNSLLTEQTLGLCATSPVDKNGGSKSLLAKNPHSLARQLQEQQQQTAGKGRKSNSRLTKHKNKLNASKEGPLREPANSTEKHVGNQVVATALDSSIMKDSRALSLAPQSALKAGGTLSSKHRKNASFDKELGRSSKRKRHGSSRSPQNVYQDVSPRQQNLMINKYMQKSGKPEGKDAQMTPQRPLETRKRKSVGNQYRDVADSDGPLLREDAETLHYQVNRVDDVLSLQNKDKALSGGACTDTKNGGSHCDRNSLPQIGGRSSGAASIDKVNQPKLATTLEQASGISESKFYPQLNSSHDQTMNFEYSDAATKTVSGPTGQQKRLKIPPSHGSHVSGRNEFLPPSAEITISDENATLQSIGASGLDQNGSKAHERRPEDGNRSPIPINLPAIARSTLRKSIIDLKESNKEKTQSATLSKKHPGSSTIGGKQQRLIKGTQHRVKSQQQSLTLNKDLPMDIMEASPQRGSELPPAMHTRQTFLIQEEQEEKAEDGFTDHLEVLAASNEKQKKRDERGAQPRRARDQQSGVQPLTQTPQVKTVRKTFPSQRVQSTTIEADHATAMKNSSGGPDHPQRKSQFNLVKRKQSTMIGQSGSLADEKTPELARRRDTLQENLISPKVEKLLPFASNQKNGGTTDKSPLKIGQSDRLYQPSCQVVPKRESRDPVIIAQAYSAEVFYKRAMKRLGWVQTAQLQALTEFQKAHFHVRFDISDLEGTSKDLKPGQFYNHFPTNRELVTKMGLCKNLWFNCFDEHAHQISHIFPRCYDLSDSKQQEGFIADFCQTAVLSIIKIMAKHFLKVNASMKSLLAHYERITVFANPENAFKKHFKRRCMQEDMRSSSVGYLLGNSEVRYAYAFAKDFCNSLQFKEKKRSKKAVKTPYTRFADEEMQSMLAFHDRLVDRGIPEDKFDTYEQFKIVRLHQKLDELLYQYRQIDGSHNIWIVKPSYNSRGHGIYCTRYLNQIMKDNKTQQKVVQKYIERPFCVDGGQRKFDFRQWVLVNSWEPLDVSVFSSAYLKLCGSQFDLKNLSDVYRHLSNYSIQKENGEKVELVMSSTQFQEYMRSKVPGAEEFTWEGTMLPRIKDVVWRTLKSVQETMDQKAGCFEVYGFDIVLDEELSPWVIEVNLSPACNERAEWLTQMLDDSSLDLLHHVQGRILTSLPGDSWSQELAQAREQVLTAPHKTTTHLNPPSFYEEYGVKDKWIRLEESIKEIKSYSRVANLPTAPQKGLQLEVPSVRADLRYEKRLDRGHRNETSALEVQRVYRGHLGRRKYRQRLEHVTSIFIQKHARRFLARLLLTRLRQNFAAKMIQKQLRGRLAVQEAGRRRAARLLALKTAIVTKLQTRYRIGKAKECLASLRKQKASLLLQSVMRGYKARKEAQKERFRKCMAVRLQRFYRRRFMNRKRSSSLVQRYIRGRLAFKKARVLGKISKGSLTLLRVLQRKQKSLGVSELRRNAKAIKIQSTFRMVRQRKSYSQSLAGIAQAKLKRILRAHCLQRLSQTAREFNRSQNAKATSVQRQLRGYLAKKRLSELRFMSHLDASATVVKRFMKGFLGKKEAKRRRIKIGAAIMIQALWRGFIVRLTIAQQQDARREAANRNKLAKREARAKRDSAMSSGADAALKSDLSRQHQKSGLTRRTGKHRGLQEDRSARYMSNPNKQGAYTGAIPSHASSNLINNTNSNNTAAIVKSNSQISLAQSTSQHSMRDGVTPATDKSALSKPYATNQSGNKKRKFVKKPRASKAENQLYNLGVKNYQHSIFGSNVHDQPSTKSKGDRESSKRAMQTQRPVIEKLYGNPSAVTEPPARLGNKIAANLQKQSVQQLVHDASRMKNLPLKREHQIQGLAEKNVKSNSRAFKMDPKAKFVKGKEGGSFNSRINEMIKTRMFEQREVSPVAQDDKSPRAVFAKRNSKDISPVLRARKSPFRGQDPRKQSAKILMSSAQQDLVTKAACATAQNQIEINNRGPADVTLLTSKPQSQKSTRNTQSFARITGQEKSATLLPDLMEATREADDRGTGGAVTCRECKPSASRGDLLRHSNEGHGTVGNVVRGLGANKDVTAVTTSLDRSAQGKGVAQTIVMRKDPSHGSLPSGREASVRKSGGKMPSYRQSLIFEGAGAAKAMAENPVTSSQVLKITKEKNKQIKTLERLVQSGAPRMHPVKAVRPTTKQDAQVAEQRQSSQDAITNGSATAQSNGRQKSFAKYLNEMLESQQRNQAFADSIGIVSRALKPPQTAEESRKASSKNSVPTTRKADRHGFAKAESTDLVTPQHAKTNFLPEVGRPNATNKVRMTQEIVSTACKVRVDADKQPTLADEDQDLVVATSAISQMGLARSSTDKTAGVRQSYSKASAAFRQTKNGYLAQIKKSQDSRMEAVTLAHKKSNQLLRQTTFVPTSSGQPLATQTESDLKRTAVYEIPKSDQLVADDQTGFDGRGVLDSQQSIRGGKPGGTAGPLESKQNSSLTHNFNSKKTTASSGKPSQLMVII